jgi:hypothetical protein
VGTYIGHPEFYGPNGIGLKGAILMGPAAFSLYPVQQAGRGGGGAPGGAAAGTGCPTATGGGGRGAGRGAPGAGPGAAPGGAAPGGAAPGGAAPGGAAPGGGGAAAKGGPGGGAPGGPGGGGRGRAQLDEATQQARSNLDGILKSKIAFFLGYGEVDIGGAATFINSLNEQLTKAGHPATVAIFKDHSHMSEVFSPNTADTSVTGPILKWMKSVK